MTQVHVRSTTNCDYTVLICEHYECGKRFCNLQQELQKSNCYSTFKRLVLRRGGIEARPGTEKRCSHNLQSGPVKTWTAVFIIINISDRRSVGDQLIRNSLQNLCVFCRGKVSGERLISHGTYCQFRTREYSMEATSMKTLLFSQCLVCCSGEWISCELCGSHVSLVYTWRPGLRQTFQS